MSAAISDHVSRLVHSLFERRSLFDRLRGLDDRVSALQQIGASGEVRAVPDLLPLIAADDDLAPHVARTIAILVRNVTPVQLSWIDEHVRRGSYATNWSNPWRQLAPAAVSTLADAHELDATVVGVLTSHANGFVRAAALEVLATHTGGQEIPFLALRANDWVEPVASRASHLLTSRLRPDNRRAVENALAFIVPVLQRQRRDHDEIAGALRAVLLSNGGEDVLAHGRELGASVRRKVYDLLAAGGSASGSPIIRAGLKDPDAVIRARALASVAVDPILEDRAAILEKFLRSDRVPAVRRLALTLISAHMPESVARVFPAVLLDRAASVRALARFIAVTYDVPVDPRAVYLEALSDVVAAHLDAAVAAVGETGSRPDADLIRPFLNDRRSRVRRSTLRALANLDAERAVTAAVAALTDASSSVRSAASAIIGANARLVDFAMVRGRVESLSNPHARRKLLRVFLEAPKWEAPRFLLEALADTDDGVRRVAVSLLDEWVGNFNRTHTQPTAEQLHRLGVSLDSAASRLPDHTAKLLRFSIKPL